MSFRSKLLSLLLIVAVVPVAFSGALSIYTSEKEMTSRIEQFQEASASLVAESIDGFLLDAITAMKLATRLIPFDQFPAPALPDALKIPYRQFDYVNIVALMDSAGRPLAPPFFMAQPGQNKELGKHESVTPDEVDVFAQHIQLKAALSSDVAFGPAYVSHNTRTPRVALSISFPVHGGQDRWVLAVELSLKKVSAKVLGAVPGPRGSAFLVDGEGKVVCHPRWEVQAQRASLADVPIVAAGLGRQAAFSLRFETPDGEEAAGSFAPVPTLAWGFGVHQPVEVAFAAVSRIRSYAIFWAVVALMVAAFGGIFFARGVSRPVRELSSGAKEIAAGKFDHQIPVRSRDEIGDLAGTFNQMATSLHDSFVTISRKNQEIVDKNIEIERWNKELLKRVEERTRELKEAHEQVLRSQRLAAVGELGAGVAHEINNPLTGIQGFAQIMLGEVAKENRFHDHLTTIIEETERIRNIVGDLLRFSQNPEGEDRVPFDINAAVLSALRMAEGQIKELGIGVDKGLAPDLPMVSGDPLALQQVFLHLINNAKTAMPIGGVLKLVTGKIEGAAVKIAVSDTGSGIPEENLSRIFDPFYTTKVEWSGRGLGLSVAHRIVEEHHGKITVQSEPGIGSTFTVILPGVRSDLHIS